MDNEVINYEFLCKWMTKHFTQQQIYMHQNIDWDKIFIKRNEKIMLVLKIDLATSKWKACAQPFTLSLFGNSLQVSKNLIIELFN